MVHDHYDVSVGCPTPAAQKGAWRNLIQEHHRGPYRHLGDLRTVGSLYQDSEIRKKVLDRVRKQQAHRRKVQKTMRDVSMRGRTGKKPKPAPKSPGLLTMKEKNEIEV